MKVFSCFSFRTQNLPLGIIYFGTFNFFFSSMFAVSLQVQLYATTSPWDPAFLGWWAPFFRSFAALLVRASRGLAVTVCVTSACDRCRTDSCPCHSQSWPVSGSPALLLRTQEVRHNRDRRVACSPRSICIMCIARLT